MEGCSEAFRQWYEGGHYFVHRSHPVFYRVGGHGDLAGEGGDTLLLIHGFPTSSWDWHRLWPTLCRRHARVIAADLIGFGYSAKPRDYDYRIADWADLQEGLLRELGVDRCHVLAHNVGDNVVQELLARQAERVQRGVAGLTFESACLLNGGLFPETQRPTLTHRLLDSAVGPHLSRLFTRRRFNRSFTRVFGARTQPEAVELLEFWNQVSCNGGIAIGHRLVGYIHEREEYRERWVGALLQTPVPLRVIDGLADPMSGAHMLQRFRELAPGADLVGLEGIGHYPQLESPEQVLRSLGAFHRELPVMRPSSQETERPPLRLVRNRA